MQIYVITYCVGYVSLLLTLVLGLTSQSCNNKDIHYILVKAPLQVLYDKIQHKGWGQVANTAQGEVQHEYTVLLLICWFCVGGLLVLSRVLSNAICCEELDSKLYECRIIA